MISVLLVDDHVDVRKILLYILEAAADIQVVATASNGVEAVTHARSNCPNVVVMDISMPLMNGIEATRQILLLCPLTRVIMLSMNATQEHIHRALAAGALGYVIKEEVPTDLLTGIRALSGGDHFFSQKIAGIGEEYLHQKENDGSED